VLQGLRHGLLGDCVEHHALDCVSLERVLLLQYFQHMPGDRFTLAIRVGCEDQLVGVLELSRDVVDALVRLCVDLPEHAEIRLGIDRAILGGEVADMAKGSQYLIARAEVLVNRLRLGRRFDYDNIHENPISYPPVQNGA
jgi:hypothetical protein